MTDGFSYDYQIGTDPDPDTGDMINVEELLDYESVPVGMAVVPFAFYQTAISGMEYGDGFPWTVWAFDYMKPDHFDALMGYLNGGQSAQVYINTREADGTYTLYSGVMHRPKIGEECQWMAGSGLWQDVKIKFTMLEAVV